MSGPKVNVSVHGTIKALLKNSVNGRHYFVIGIIPDNLTRLAADEPIAIDLVELGIKKVDNVILIYGKDEAEVRARISAIRPEGYGLSLPGRGTKN